MSANNIDVITAPSSDWYDDIIFYLIHGYAPSTLDLKKCRTLPKKHLTSLLIMCCFARIMMVSFSSALKNQRLINFWLIYLQGLQVDIILEKPQLPQGIESMILLANLVQICL